MDPGSRQVSTDGLALPHRYWAIVTIALGVTMAVMDSAIANIALPTIARDLHTTAVSSIWVVNGYQLTITISLLPLAALGDILGYRRIYLAGLALFTIASLACAASFSLTTLAIARMIQGFGAAGILSVNSALVRFTYPQRLLGHGIGINALIVAVAAATGPTIASLILAFGRWPWLFAVNLPLGLAALAIGRRYLPQSPQARHPFDFVSAILSAAAFALVIACIDALGQGQSLTVVGSEGVLAATLAVLLVRRQRTLHVPLLPVDLLAIPIFRLSIMTSIGSFAAQMLALVSLPFLIQWSLGHTAVHTGFLITPWPIATGLAAPIAGRLAERYPAGLLGSVGLLIFAAGLIALSLISPHAPDLDIIWRMALAGLGFGLFQSPNNRAMLNSAPLARSGGASGMLGTARLLGQTTGVALVGLVFARQPETGTITCLRVAAAFAIAAAIVSGLRLRPQKKCPDNSLRPNVPDGSDRKPQQGEADLLQLAQPTQYITSNIIAE